MADEEKGTESGTPPEEKKGKGGLEKSKSLTRLGPPVLDRKKTLMIIAGAVAAIVMGGFVWNSLGSGGKKKAEADTSRVARGAPDFLRSQRDRALQGSEEEEEGEELTAEIESAEEPVIPEAVYSRPAPPPATASSVPPPPGAQQGGGGGGGGKDPGATAKMSALAARVEGVIYGRQSGEAGAGSGGSEQSAMSPGDAAVANYMRQVEAMRAAQQASAAGAAPLAAPSAGGAQQDTYAAQNNQTNKEAFYTRGSGKGGSGGYIGENALWIGTIIPGALITGINTDLPGEITARVTANIYDSQTGRKLLVPQGTILVAQYNSSVSYAQHRVQIIWNTMIRPDGYLMDLGGMNGVDEKGVSGQGGDYHENWFEYAKAAGIVALFSIANSKMTADVAKYGNDEAASAVAQGNAELVGQIGDNIISRALNIQPTLTVDPGTPINIMLNQNLYLPPVEAPAVTQKYALR